MSILLVGAVEWSGAIWGWSDTIRELKYHQDHYSLSQTGVTK